MAPDMLQGMWFYGLPLGQDCHAAHGIGLPAYCQPAVAEYSVLVESSEDGLHKVAGTGDSVKKRKAGAKEEDSDTANAKKKKKKLALEETEALEHSDNNTKKKEGLRESSHSKAASEQPKTEYIQVRARRGQATDSHSLAERVRREKIGERMKYLQDLVPGCNNITGKASVLDEIINYVQSLQKQVQFLSMKLAAADPLTDFNMHSFVEKEVCGSSAWDYNLQQLYNKMDIARGRVNAFPFHLHQGGDNRV